MISKRILHASGGAARFNGGVDHRAGNDPTAGRRLLRGHGRNHHVRTCLRDRIDPSGRPRAVRMLLQDFIAVKMTEGNP